MAVEIADGEKRTFTAKQRQTMAKGGQALSDGSYPIANEGDLKNAIQAIGRAKNPGKAKAHIKKRASALGLTKLLPEGWKAMDEENESEDDGEEEKDKDYSMMPMVEIYQPYGGAISFDEVESREDALEYSYKVDQLTDQLRCIIHNITASDEIETDDKVSKITEAASSYRQRVNAMSEKELKELRGDIGLLQKIKSVLFPEEKLGDKENLILGSSFKVLEDSEGHLRWVATSSNAFEDREQELFSTKALSEGIEYADKSGERGPLLIFHIPEAVVGQCDYQGLAGRFLIESGTFADTPMGQKAADYFANTEEAYQVSIGYKYRIGDEADKTYDWMRFRERSVCPAGTAANPWTDFNIFGGEKVKQSKIDELNKILGPDLAAETIAKAESKTKELEESGIRFKTVEEDSKKKDDEEEDMAKHGDMKKEGEVPAVIAETSAEAATAAFVEQMAGITRLVADLTATVESLSILPSAIKEINEQIVELKKSDDEKIATALTPRNSTVALPTADPKNIMEDGKEVTGSKEDQPVNPAAAYVADLVGAVRNGQSNQ